MTTKTKDQILDSAMGDTIEYPHYYLDNTQRSVAIEAMEIFAKQQSIEFAKWMDKQGYTSQGDLWESFNDRSFRTTEELYTQFTEHQLLKENNQ